MIVSRHNPVYEVTHADRSIVWTARDGGDLSSATLFAHGMTEEDTERMLLTLAADVHHKRTGRRAGAILIEDGDVTALHKAARAARECFIGPSFLQGPIDALRALITDRGLR